jgi:hypothetical protein
MLQVCLARFPATTEPSAGSVTADEELPASAFIAAMGVDFGSPNPATATFGAVPSESVQ